MKKYRKRENIPVVAVQLRLETEGFSYQKWGDTQQCKAGDWLVNNQGEVYTIDDESFAATYREVSQGLYQKVATVWAEVAEEDGTISTKEGSTDYQAGDYLVYNQKDRGDGYAMSPEKFASLYEEDES